MKFLITPDNKSIILEAIKRLRAERPYLADSSVFDIIIDEGQEFIQFEGATSDEIRRCMDLFDEVAAERVFSPC